MSGLVARNYPQNICRACMKIEQDLVELSTKITVNEENLTIINLLKLCTSIQIAEMDELPQVICTGCKNQAINCYLFRIMCEDSERKFRQLDTIQSSCEIINERSDDKVDNMKPQLDKRTCPYCLKTFQYRSSMLKHKKEHNAPPKKCPFCDYVPPTPTKLSVHMDHMHPQLKTHRCSTCKKSFFKQNNLKLHMIVHTGVKKHTCEICGMSFALSGNLSAHRRLHTGEKPYTCSQCGRGFTQQSALKSHEAGHSDRRDHRCEECGAAFSRAGALRNHQKRHSKERPFDCAMCGQAFAFSAELKRHKTIHTGDKRFACEVCGRGFNRSSNLKVHRLIHTGETPHVCSVCGKGFRQSHSYRLHMNTHNR